VWIERAAFFTVLSPAPPVFVRLGPGGGALAAGLPDRGRRELDQHHLFRAMAWLGEKLAKNHQVGATPSAPRFLKDVL
jgi:hypothetical protein